MPPNILYLNFLPLLAAGKRRIQDLVDEEEDEYMLPSCAAEKAISKKLKTDSKEVSEGEAEDGEEE